MKLSKILRQDAITASCEKPASPQHQAIRTEPMTSQEIAGLVVVCCIIGGILIIGAWLFFR